MVRSIDLWALPNEINDSVYASGKYPMLVDPTGQSCRYVNYRGRGLSIFKKGDFEKENLRRSLTQALHNGAWLVLDFDNIECDLLSFFDKDHFPESVLSPHELFLEETYKPLLRKGDEFSAKILYEHDATLAQGAFQDRTKAHAPERVADVDKTFQPKNAFRLIVCTKLDPPDELLEKFDVLKVTVSEKQVEEDAGVWAGREMPTETKTKEQIKMDSDLLECAFDGELGEVKKLLDKGADPMAKDGRGHMPLSEAAVQGHLETVRFLLDWKAPIGTDPNAQGSDGRSALHRAAFQGHVEVVNLLLERGSDPRLKDRQGERPFDMASNDESRTALTSWDVATTDKLKEERKKAVDEQQEKNVRNEEERVALERQRKLQVMKEYIEQNEKDSFEIELNGLDDPGQIGTFRDDRGNTVLHMAAELDRLDICVALIDDFGMNVNAQEAKGWTPIAIAAFRGHKKLCLALMERKADPEARNAYRKNAFDVAKDSEIKEVLTVSLDGQAPPPSAGAASSSGEGGPAAKAKAKGKAKAKAKAAAASDTAPAAAAGSGASAAKALAKGKAKAKAKGKAK